MATRVPSTVATAPMQKASSRRPVSLMIRLPCSARVRPAGGLHAACCCWMIDQVWLTFLYMVNGVTHRLQLEALSL